jgi:hypothetical protein
VCPKCPNKTAPALIAPAQAWQQCLGRVVKPLAGTVFQLNNWGRCENCPKKLGLIQCAVNMGILYSQICLLQIICIWLVVWNMNFMTFHILGMSSSQLTTSEKGLKPPTGI